MRCEETQTRLQEYLDGQLDLNEAQVIKAHLDVCFACQEELRLLRQVDEALAALPILQEPVDLTARVMARISLASLPVFRLRWEDAVVSLAFSVTMVAVLSIFSLLGRQQVLTARAILHQAWWTLMPELDRLWRTAQMEPVYVVWGVSTLCAAAAAAASTAVLIRQWHRQPLTVSGWRHRG